MFTILPVKEELFDIDYSHIICMYNVQDSKENIFNIGAIKKDNSYFICSDIDILQEDKNKTFKIDENIYIEKSTINLVVSSVSKTYNKEAFFEVMRLIRNDILNYS